MNCSLSHLLPKAFRSEGPTIPVVRLQGMILAGNSPAFRSLSLASISGVLEKAFSYPGPALAIAINSPGGSPVQSRLIYKRIRDLANKEKKKIFVFVEDVAASGGYMIALAGDEIIADPSSIVGSIGVVSSGFGFQDLMRRIGVERRVHVSGKNKVLLDPFQPEKEESVAHLKKLQGEIHESFISLVKERRGSKLAESEDLFTGLFWAGARAHALGLVDGLGDMHSCLKSRYGEQTRLKWVGRSQSLFRRTLGLSRSGLRSVDIAESVGEVVTALEERALWQRYRL